MTTQEVPLSEEVQKKQDEENDISLLPSKVFVLALKKYVAIEEIGEIQIITSESGRRRLVGKFTSVDADGKEKNYRINTYIQSIPLPGAQPKPERKKQTDSEVQLKKKRKRKADSEVIEKLKSEIETLKTQLSKPRRTKKRQHVSESDYTDEQ